MSLEPIERISNDVTSPGIIVSMHADLINVPLKKDYSMGGMDYSNVDYAGMVVRVRTEDGVEGVGEVFITSSWYGPESDASIWYLVNNVFNPIMVGESVFCIAKIVQKMDEARMNNFWAKTAVELALHDAASKTLNRPLIDLIGGKARDRFPVVGGIGTGTPDEMAETAREYVDRGFTSIKIKIGERANPALDVDRLRVVREEVGSDIKLTADANTVFDVLTSIPLIRKMEPYDLAYIEQPIPAWDIEGMATIRQAIDTPLMADESVHTARDAINVIKARAADLIKIKIAKCGGYRRAQEIITVSELFGIGIVVGNGKGTSAASLHELNLVCATPSLHLAGEFPGPDKLVSDIMMDPMLFVEGDAILPTGPGIGSEIDYEKFNACRIDFLEMVA